MEFPFDVSWLFSDRITRIVAGELSTENAAGNKKNLEEVINKMGVASAKVKRPKK